MPGVNPNSNVTPGNGSYHVGDSIQYACSVGYVRANGSTEEICRQDGSWSKADPIQCQSKKYSKKRKEKKRKEKEKKRKEKKRIEKKRKEKKRKRNLCLGTCVEIFLMRVGKSFF